MTEEQLKTLADLVLTNDSRLTHLVSLYQQLVESFLPLLPEKESTILLVHQLEQLSGAVQASVAARKQARIYFGLPDEGDAA
jgi:hypothetical protein